MAVMIRRAGGHPDEDTFEEYLFGRLCADEVASVEEHLLVCEECQETLDHTIDHIRLMKAATAAFASAPSRIIRTGSPALRSPGFRSDGLRRNAATAAILLLMCLTALLSWRKQIADPKTVELSTYRAGGVAALPQAPSGRPLHLKIDLTDLPQASGFRVEVVDASGQRVWFGGTPALLSKGLPPGVYWIRLYTDQGELLREFGLRSS